MSETWDLRMKIYKYTLIVAAIVAGISFFFVDGYIKFLTGLVFGTLISMLNFGLLAKTVEKAVTMDPEKAKVYMSSRYSIRFFLYGAVIYISVVADYINVLGTIVGILNIKGIIYAINIFDDKEFLKRIFKKKDN